MICMLSSRDIAEMFKVSRTTIYNWEQKGILKPVFISPTGRKFYSEENIKELYESRKVGD